MSRKSNYKAFRELLATCTPPCLPYLGTFLTDLTFIEEGNPDTMSATSPHTLVEEKKAAERSVHTAASKGDLAALSRIVEQGTIHVDAPDDGGYTPLLKAAANNHLDCVDFLLAKVRLTRTR